MFAGVTRPKEHYEVVYHTATGLHLLSAVPARASTRLCGTGPLLQFGSCTQNPVPASHEEPSPKTKQNGRCRSRDAPSFQTRKQGQSSMYLSYREYVGPRGNLWCGLVWFICWFIRFPCSPHLFVSSNGPSSLADGKGTHDYCSGAQELWPVRINRSQGRKPCVCCSV